MRSILTIWIKPIKTFEYLSTREQFLNNRYINIIIFLASIGIGQGRILELSQLIPDYFFISIGIAILALGLIGLFLFKIVISWLFWLTGKILQGQATKDEVELVVAYSLIPNIIHIAIGILMIIPAIIMDRIDLIFFQHPITSFVVWIISMRSMIFGLSLFNKFSFGYAILTIFIPVGTIQGVIYLINHSMT